MESSKISSSPFLGFLFSTFKEGGFPPLLFVTVSFLFIRYIYPSTIPTSSPTLDNKNISCLLDPNSSQNNTPKSTIPLEIKMPNTELVTLTGSSCAKELSKSSIFQCNDIASKICDYLSSNDYLVIQSHKNPIFSLDSAYIKYRNSRLLIEMNKLNRVLPEDLNVVTLDPITCNTMADNLHQDNLALLRSLQKVLHLDPFFNITQLSPLDCQAIAEEFHDESFLKMIEATESLLFPIWDFPEWPALKETKNASIIREFLYNNSYVIDRVSKYIFLQLSLKSVPPEIKLFTKVISLNFTDNKISSLTLFTNLPSLQSLNLSCNRIIDPTPLIDLPKLRYLYLGENQIYSPNFLLNSSLPSLKKLQIFEQKFEKLNRFFIILKVKFPETEIS